MSRSRSLLIRIRKSLWSGARTQVRCFQSVTVLSRCFWQALTANPRSTSASIWPRYVQCSPAFVSFFCLCVPFGVVFFCLFVWFKTGFTSYLKVKFKAKMEWIPFALLLLHFFSITSSLSTSCCSFLWNSRKLLMVSLPFRSSPKK